MKKPLHKHIGNHARRIHRNITKYLYERDTIFATGWVFIFIIMVKFLPLNLHFLDPMKLALEDFDFNDIAYSKLKSTDNSLFDKRIVIVNIGHADREGIALMIDKVASYHPKVMGLDVFFAGPKEETPRKDSLLRTVFERTNNLVVVSRINDELWKHKDKLTFKPDYFDSAYHQRGYANLIGEEKGSIRSFSPFEEDKETKVVYPSFAAVLVYNYDTVEYNRLKKRHRGQEIINYTRRVNESVKQYQLIEGEVLLNDQVDESYLKNKIVLLGYVNIDENDIEDKVFTPLNEKFAGKSRPDMNGIVVWANTISMILDHNYIKKLPLWFTILLAVLIGWLHMSFFIRYYLENHIWFHLIAKIAQVISAIFFVYLGIFLFTRYRIKMDMALTVIVIALCVDIIYFYEAFAVWIHKKFGFKTVFHQKHH